MFSNDETEEALKDLADLGIISEKINPKTMQKEIKLNDDKDKSAEPKLMPILENLLKDKNTDEVKKDEIDNAC